MSDAQYLIDLAKNQYNEVADGIERHFESVATQLREWLPRSIQPPPPPPRRLPATYWQSVQRWISRNQAITAAFAAFIGTGAVYLLVQRHGHIKKRRAKRSANGARTEVVVIAGSVTSPITTALALDLERRGFIVYVVTSSAEDEHHVRSQSRVDILPLNLDIVYPDAAQEQLNRFHQLLSRHHHAFEGAPSHRLTLAGVILVPDTQSPTGAIADLSPAHWSSGLNNIQNAISRTQLLLPLITDFKSKLLVLTPSVVPSLRPPHHAIESTVSSALEAFTATLATELAFQDLRVCHFKLGHLDLPNSRPRKDGNRLRGTSLRKLHDSVFDALASKRPARTWHVGRGSLVYDVIGGWLPAGIVGRMMGMQRQAPLAIEDVSDREDEGSESSMQWEKVEQSA